MAPCQPTHLFYCFASFSHLLGTPPVAVCDRLVEPSRVQILVIFLRRECTFPQFRGLIMQGDGFEGGLQLVDSFRLCDRWCSLAEVEDLGFPAVML